MLLKPTSAKFVPGLALTLALLSGITAPAGAQAPPAIGADVPVANIAVIERVKQALAEAGLDSVAREPIEKTLAAATADEQAAEQALLTGRAIDTEARQADAEIRRLQADLDTDPARALATWRAQQPARETTEAMERRLEQQRAQVQQQRQALVAANANRAEALSSPAALNEDIGRLRQLLESRRSAATAAHDALGAEAGLSIRARAVAADAALRHTAAALFELQVAEQTLPVRQRLYDARRRSLERQIAIGEQRIAVLQTQVEQRQTDRVTAQRARIATEQADYARADPALQALATENLALADRLTSVVAQLGRSRRDAETAARAATDADAALRTTQARLALEVPGGALGLLLLDERRRLVEPDALQNALDDVRGRLATLRLDLLDLGERSDALADLPSAVANAIQTQRDEDENLTALREGYYHLLGSRAQLLPSLIESGNRLASSLATQEHALQTQLLATRELVRILDRQLLWVPSHAPVDSAWLGRHPAGWADLVMPARIIASAQRVAVTARSHWPITAIALALFVAGLWFRLHLGARLDALAQPLKRIRGDRYRYTLQALLVTALAAMPWAALCLGLGWLLCHAGNPGKFSHSLGTAVLWIAPGVYAVGFLDALCRDRGLAHAHFRWSAVRRRALTRLRPWLAFGLLPLMFGFMLAFVRRQEPVLDTAGRELLTLWCLLAAAALWQLFAVDGVFATRTGQRELDARRRALRVLLPAGAIITAGLALVGYVVSAGALAYNVWLSMLLVLGVALLHGLLTRWLLLGERRLALRRMEVRHEAERDGTSADATVSGDASPEIEPDEMAMHSVSAQSRRVLRALTIALIAIGLLWIWSGLLPALERLDEVTLWRVQSTDAGGAAMAQAITLKLVAIGLAVLALTFVAARNLPGLMELSLLSRINLDAPTRYAITSISRYLIVIGGVITGLSLFGLRWGQLQWMAAALTVGLGFGLQEIFANFVSGLIVLFERPYRVGDIVTIGEVEGTVTRIRTRATTIVDWDNKEVVIPNRMFITERFVNWTLSDAVTRVVMTLGVAYGSDPERVRRLLLEIAAAEPRVLPNPPPTCFFTEIGGSTYNYELRVFVAEIIDRNPTRTALLTRVVQRFGEEQIELAFPQMDLHLRAVPDGFGGIAAAPVGGAGATSAASINTPPNARPG